MSRAPNMLPSLEYYSGRTVEVRPVLTEQEAEYVAGVLVSTAIGDY